VCACVCEKGGGEVAVHEFVCVYVCGRWCVSVQVCERVRQHTLVWMCMHNAY
jgi:hypothetical protein